MIRVLEECFSKSIMMWSEADGNLVAEKNSVVQREVYFPTLEQKIGMRKVSPSDRYFLLMCSSLKQLRFFVLYSYFQAI